MQMMTLPYDLTGPIGARAVLALAVLQTDETIEQDFRRLFPEPDVAVYVSRVPSAPDVSSESLAGMEAHLPRTAAELPQSLEYDVMGYGCTSGATVIGPDRVAALLGQSARLRAVTDPMTAAKAAFRALDVRRIAFLSPYVAEVSQALRASFEADGFEIAGFGSFDEAEEAKVARIAPASILEAACLVGAAPDAEAVFLSCTNLRTLDMIVEAEERLGKPVVSSNQALGWHMAQLGNLPSRARSFGRLTETSVVPS